MRPLCELVSTGEHFLPQLCTIPLGGYLLTLTFSTAAGKNANGYCSLRQSARFILHQFRCSQPLTLGDRY